MRKVLFIDRDGTLIKEPHDEQIDSFEKLVFYPKALFYLSKIADELDYDLVMVTNQDGLGTDAYPENDFWPTHNFMLKTFENEGVVFKEQIIDRSFPEKNSPNRKPRIGLMTKYFSEEYDLKNSFVIGDRLTDMELAKNLNAKGIFINDDTHFGTDEVSVDHKKLDDFIVLETNEWERIYEFLKLENRTAKFKRKTNETNIEI